jgi:hypothetical protein
MINLVNRSAFLVRPQQPSLDWIARLAADGGALEAERIRADAAASTSVYLVDPDDDGDDEAPPISRFYRAIFEEELAGWTDDESLWPSPRTLELFNQWFTVVAESMVIDLGKRRIRTETI